MEQATATPMMHIRRGEYVTGTSDAVLDELAWLSCFNVVHASGVEDTMSVVSVNMLRKYGVKKILAYEWMPAGYQFYR